MSLLSSKRIMAVLAFILTSSPALSKSLASASQLFTDSGQFNPEYITTVVVYSPVLILTDVAFTLLFLYYFKFLKKYRANQKTGFGNKAIAKSQDR